MERGYFVDHRDTRILHLDYSGISDPEELRGAVRAATALVRTQALGSLRVLVDVSGVPHGLVTAAILQQGVLESRPYVRARAVIGLPPAAATQFEVAASLFGNPMASFGDPGAATEWLLAQA
jgi:hypothetical protein